MAVTLYSAPLTMDAFNRAVTIAVTALVFLTSLAVGGSAFLFESEFPMHWPLIPCALIGPVILVICLLYAPRAVVLTDKAVLVQRYVSEVRIELSSIRNAEALARFSGVTLRKWGVGGFFGNYGDFWNREIGSFALYATRNSDLVLLRTEGKPVILTPADSEAFLQALRPLLQRD